MESLPNGKFFPDVELVDEIDAIDYIPTATQAGIHYICNPLTRECEGLVAIRVHPLRLDPPNHVEIMIQINQDYGVSIFDLGDELSQKCGEEKKKFCDFLRENI